MYVDDNCISLYTRVSADQTDHLMPEQIDQ